MPVAEACKLPLNVHSLYKIYDKIVTPCLDSIAHSNIDIHSVKVILNLKKISDQILSAVVLTETLSWGFQQFFPTGTYIGIGTTCVELENVMKSAMKKKLFSDQA